MPVVEVLAIHDFFSYSSINYLYLLILIICLPPSARRVYVVDDIVRYGCNEGFFTDSTAPEAKCTEAGVWSANPIQCRRVACGSPPLPEHTSARGLHGDSFLYGSQYLYTCLQGYTMKVS